MNKISFNSFISWFHFRRNVVINTPATKISQVVAMNIKKAPCSGQKMPEGMRQLALNAIESFRNGYIKLKTEIEQLKEGDWPSLLSKYHQVHHFSDQLTNLRTRISSDLIHPEFALLDKLKVILIQTGFKQEDVCSYLSRDLEERVIRDRLFQHSEIQLEANPSAFCNLSKSVELLKTNLDKAIINLIKSKYISIPNQGGGDCLFHSCEQLCPATSSDWRRLISQHLSDNRKLYEVFVAERIRTDEMAARALNWASGGDSYERYCNWISLAGSWGSEPELRAYSELNQRPIIVIQDCGDYLIEIPRCFNLHYSGVPLIFVNHSEAHYEAMI